MSFATAATRPGCPREVKALTLELTQLVMTAKVCAYCEKPAAWLIATGDHHHNVPHCDAHAAHYLRAICATIAGWAAAAESYPAA